MHLNFRNHVTAHRDAMRLRQRGDLPPGRHAADPGQIENHHVDGLGLEQLPERVEVIQVLARRDRHLEPAPKRGEPGHVRVMHGIFEPRDARVLQEAPGAPGARQRPALDRVHHDADARPDRVAHGLDASRLRLGRRLLAEPELHGPEPVGDVALRRFAELLR